MNPFIPTILIASTFLLSGCEFWLPQERKAITFCRDAIIDDYKGTTIVNIDFARGNGTSVRKQAGKYGDMTTIVQRLKATDAFGSGHTRAVSCSVSFHGGHGIMRNYDGQIFEHFEATY